MIKEGRSTKDSWHSKACFKNAPEIKYLHIVEILGIDIQADGGPHVRNTSEIGEIVFMKAANKGKKRKRLYYTVRPLTTLGCTISCYIVV